jgi:hypothetical protein
VSRPGSQCAVSARAVTVSQTPVDPAVPVLEPPLLETVKLALPAAPSRLMRVVTR